MAELGFDFDHTAVDISSNFDPLPAGEYVVEVVGSDLKQTKTNTGEYIALELRVVEGQYENRRVFSNINHRNAKADTQAIGECQLAELIYAVGLKDRLKDTAELHSVPIIARLNIKEGSNGYGPRNNVVAFKPVNGEKHAVVAPLRVFEPSKPAAPWKR